MAEQYSSQQIADYIKGLQDQGGTNADIAAAMDQFGVSVADVANATGVDQKAIQDEYNRVTNTTTAPLSQPVYTSPSQVLNGLQSGALDQSNVTGALQSVASNYVEGTPTSTSNTIVNPYSSDKAPATANDTSNEFNKTYNALQYGNTKVVETGSDESGQTTYGVVDGNGKTIPATPIDLGNGIIDLQVGSAGGIIHTYTTTDENGNLKPVQDYASQVQYTGGDKGGFINQTAKGVSSLPGVNMAVAIAVPELLPYLQGANAINSYNNKDFLGMAKSALGATDALPTGTLPFDTSTIKDALNVTTALDALKSKNPVAYFNAVMQATDTKLPSDIGAGLKLASAYISYQKGDGQALINQVMGFAKSTDPLVSSSAQKAIDDIKNGIDGKVALDNFSKNVGLSSDVTNAISNLPSDVVAPLVDNTGVTGDQSLANAYTNTGSVVTGEGPQRATNDYTAQGSFGDAFKAARDQLGGNATFTYDGKQYTTATAPTTPVSEWDTNAGPKAGLVSEWDTNSGTKAGISSLDPRSVRYSGYDTNQAVLNASDQANKELIKNLGNTTDPLTGQAIYNINTGDTLKESDQTNPLNVIKAGFSQAGSDIAGLGVRGAQFLGSVLGFDTSGLNQVQNLLQNSAQTDMNKLVGQERNVAGAISSTIESVGSAMVGGPLAAVPAMGAIVANNSWVEGANAGLDNTQNAIRTTLMASAEMLGEAIGVPGMNKILKNIPTNASPSEIINAVKTFVGAQVNEQFAEQATTAMQMGVDTIKGIGLHQDAKLEDYLKAVKDTAVQTMLTVGGAHAMVGGANAIGQGGSNYVATGDQTNTPVTAPTITNVGNVSKVNGGMSANDNSQNVINITPSVQTSNQAPTSGSLALAPSFNPDVEVETHVDPETQVKTETQTDPETKVQTEVKTDPNTQVQTQTVTNPNTKVETKTVVDPKTNTKTEVVSDPNSNTKTEVVTNPETKTETKTDTKTNIVEKTVTNNQTNEQTKTITDPTTNTKTEIVVDPVTNTTTTTVIDLKTGEIIDPPTVVVTPPKPPVEPPKPPVEPPKPPVEPPKPPPEPPKPPPEPPKPPVEPTPTPSPTPTPTPTTTKTQPSTISPYTPQGGPGHIPNPIVESLLKTYMTKEGFKDPLARLEALAKESQQSERNMIDPRLASILQQRSAPQEANYYRYGQEPQSVDDVLSLKGMEQAYKTGGHVQPLTHASGGALPVVQGRHDFRHGAHVAGEGDGTSDDIPAMLADGEFVFPADVVSALGNGSTKAGTDKLYEMMHAIRARARKSHPSDLPPDALKSPLDYLKGRKK